MKTTFSLFLLSLTVSLSLAQNPEFQKEKDVHSTWEITASKTKGIEVGDIISLTIRVTPDKQWSLYSSNGEGEIAFLPTSLALTEENNGIELSEGLTDQKAPHEENDEIMGGIIRHYETGEEVVYIQKIKVTEKKFNLSAGINGQICFSDGMCVMLSGKITWVGKTGS